MNAAPARGTIYGSGWTIGGSNPPLEHLWHVLKAAVLGSYESLRLLVHRGPGAKFPLTGTMKATIRAWDNTQNLLVPASESLSLASLLWLVPRFPHFFLYLIQSYRGQKGLGPWVTLLRGKNYPFLMI